MIDKTTKQTIVNMGAGDITINAGYGIGTDSKMIGAIGFEDIATGEVRQFTDDYFVGHEPVLLTFSTTESIDLLIEQLKRIKKADNTRKEDSK